MAKVNVKWALMCSAAIAAIYASGYYATINQAPKDGQVLVFQNGNQQYKNGTFYGVGSNRRGSIQVAVTIQNDQIVNVEIVDFRMHYSIRDVVGKPEEVVKRQSANVSNVSGATYSIRAFHDSVVNALNQATRS